MRIVISKSIGVATSAVGDLFTWWLHELSAIIPASIRKGRGSRVEVRSAFVGYEVTVRGSRGSSIVSTIEPGQPPSAELTRMIARTAQSNVILHLDPTIVISRQIEIPEAAGSQIRGLLEFDMDKWTPYEFKDVYVTWSTKSSRERSKLEVQLYVSPRSHVDPILADLERLGLRVSAVALDPKCTDIHLIRVRSRNGLYFYAATTVALLSLLAVDWTSLVESRNRWTERHAFEAKQYADQRALQELIARTMASVGSASGSSRRSETLRAVSTALPESDWLQEVVIKGQSITVRGFTAKIEALSKALEPLAERGEIDIQGEVAYDASLDRSRFSLTYVERRN